MNTEQVYWDDDMQTLVPVGNSCNWIAAHLDVGFLTPRIAYFSKPSIRVDGKWVESPPAFCIQGSEADNCTPGLRFCPGCGRELELVVRHEERE